MMKTYIKNNNNSNFLNKNKLINNKLLIINNNITLAQLANQTSKSLNLLLKITNNLGEKIKANEIISKELLLLIAEEINIKIKFYYDVNNNFTHTQNLPKSIGTRNIIVTIIGHVDHGKTSLLDLIKKSNITSKEIGGITQHINAYKVNTNKGNITFIDTPGHIVFNNMLEKGIKFTDIVLLIIAANDGLKPHMINILNLIIKLNLPIIVCINKIDLNNNITFIKNELIKYNIIPIEWGGNYYYVNISVKKKIGIDLLLDTINIVGNKLNLNTYLDGKAKGNILDAYVDPKRGKIINSIIMEGKLKQGDIFICGAQWAKVKKIYDIYNYQLEEATPSLPVKILGLSSLSNLHETFRVVENDKQAKQLIEKYIIENNISNNTNNKILNVTDKLDIPKLNIILKTNSKESEKSICNLLINLPVTKLINLQLIKVGIGLISEQDVSLALDTKSYLIGFNVNVDKKLKLKNLPIKLMFYNIIYNLIDDIETLINQLTSNTSKSILVLGEGKVKNIFNKFNKINPIIGCVITKGFIHKNHIITIYHEETQIYNGKIKSLKQYKDNVQEVKVGGECGIIIDNNKNCINIHIGDLIKTS